MHTRTMQLARFSVALAVLVFTLPGLHAQNIFGSIVGTVDDPSGALIPAATVTVTSITTGEKRTVSTNSEGDYQVLSLARGTYRIDIDANGFKHFTRSPIDVAVDQVARVNVAMVIGEPDQVVTVNSAPPIMQTDSASLGQVVSGKAVQDLPLNGRNVLNLVALVPGVVPQGGTAGNLSGQNVFAAGNYQIDGGNANQGSILVDGSPVNTSYGNNTVLVMDQDSIQEFNAQTHNNTAEFGMYAGGVINMSTKSGTNAFHGSAYEYLRNTVLDASNFFSNRTNSGRQPWHQNQFGANIGGPIKKDKFFIFGDYQGYRQTNGQPIVETLPTAAELTGDFSGISAPIYDPLTTCGYNGNPACTAAQQAGTAPQRQQFSYNGVKNVIPPNRMSTVANNLIKFPIYGKPNVPGTMTAEGPVNNFSSLSTAGGKNDQFTIRGDQNLNAKNTAFERYTWWKSMNIDPQPFLPDNNIYYSVLSPEAFTTQQIVLGDTYVVGPTSVADVHLSYLRWNYHRTPTNLGLNLSQTFGFPSYMNYGDQNLAGSNNVPYIATTGPISYYEGNADYIYSINNNYAISSTFQKAWKRHTVKVGLDLRRLEMDYFQVNQPGGYFSFDNIFTSQNVGSPGTTGNGLASFELGYGSTNANQSVQISPPTFQTMYYQGYFAQDTWQITNKLTASLGLRWEVPGTYRARHGWANTFNPTETNTVVGIPGAFDLVSSPQHPAAGQFNENWDNWSPRVGLAYRVTDTTVIRGAWGKFVIPSDLNFYSAPLEAGVNFLNNVMVNSVNGEQTPANTLDNPYPNGLQAPPHRNTNYQQVLLGGNSQAILADQPNGETFQWNVSVEHQFPLDVVVTASYSALKGDHLPASVNTVGVNALPDSVIAQAAADPNCSTGNFGSCFLNKSVANPFYPKISQGALSQSTVTENQLLRPFPQYGSLFNSAAYFGISDYQAFELKVQKRMQGGGQILGAYTFSKLLTNAESLTTFLDSYVGNTTAGFQDFNNPRGEYSLSSFDARQRLVVSFLYPLPIGRGKRLLGNLNSVANAFIGGWGVDGITTFQEGFPLAFSETTNILGTYAFQGTERPNVVPGCAKGLGGSVYNRLGGSGSTNTYFNANCFTNPADFTFGNEPRTDNVLRTPGTANWDMSIYKDIPVHERMTFNFRVEAFNLFNRVQFAAPNTTAGSTTFGWITAQFNNPRLLQVSGRLSF